MFSLDIHSIGDFVSERYTLISSIYYNTHVHLTGYVSVIALSGG
jgi:hypothetical protein